MNKTVLISIIALFAINSAIFSQKQLQDELNPVITGVPSLSITPDARAGGMGDVGAATTPDINSQYWNPAKYAFMESEVGFSFSYTPWLRKLVNDIDLGYVTGYYRFADRQTLSASLRYFSLGDVALTYNDGSPMGNAKPYEMAFDAAYSILLSEQFSGAIALRYIRSDLTNGYSSGSYDMHAGNAFAADIAFYYKTPVYFSTGDGSFGAGLNISNLGTKISYDDMTSNFIPTNLRLGASLDYPMDDYNKISFSADIDRLLVPNVPRNLGTDSVSKTDLQDYYNTSPIAGIFKSFNTNSKDQLRNIMWGIGAEYAYNKQFFVRAGYFNESKYKGNRKYFTAGLGFKLNVFELNAGYVISVAQQNPLDNTLRISLGFDLNAIKNLAN